MRRITDPFLTRPPLEDLAAQRERPLAAATGLSVGVEGERFPANVRDTSQATRTFAQVEADLVASIRHATVGSTLPEFTERRPDGREAPLSGYRGRVPLIDF